MPTTFDVAYGYGEGYSVIAFRPPFEDENMAEEVAQILGSDGIIGLEDCTEFEFEGEDHTIGELKEAAVLALEQNQLKLGKLIGPIVLHDELGGSIFDQAKA